MSPFSGYLMAHPRNVVGLPKYLTLYLFCRCVTNLSMSTLCDAVTRKSSMGIYYI